MDDKTRARKHYDAAVSLLIEDCERVIERLERTLTLSSDSDVCVFIGDTWHYLLKALDKRNEFRTYEKYSASPAWKRKRDLVIERDKGKCVWCQAEGKQVHHKTYDNIGKEPLSDLVLLCVPCHIGEHCVPFDLLPDTQPPLESPSGKASAKEAFIAYVQRESDILQLSDSERSRPSAYVNYDSGYPTKNGFPEIQLSAWLPVDYNDVAAVISIHSNSKYFESHYKKFEEYKSRIEDTFSFEEVKLRSSRGGRVYHLRVVKKGVDLTLTADRETAFRWLRENLEKLYWVLRVPDTLRWDNT